MKPIKISIKSSRFLIMILVGAIIGLVNGLFIVKLKMNAFIVTIAMLIILRGATLTITGAHIVINLPESFLAIAKVGIGPFQLTIFFFIASFNSEASFSPASFVVFKSDSILTFLSIWLLRFFIL